MNFCVNFPIHAIAKSQPEWTLTHSTFFLISTTFISQVTVLARAAGWWPARMGLASPEWTALTPAEDSAVGPVLQATPVRTNPSSTNRKLNFINSRNVTLSSFTLRRQWRNFHYFCVVKCRCHKWLLWYQMEVFTRQRHFKGPKLPLQPQCEQGLYSIFTIFMSLPIRPFCTDGVSLSLYDWFNRYTDWLKN